MPTCAVCVQLAKAEKLKPLEVELRRLEDLSKSIVDDFAYMRAREEEMRDTNGRFCFFSEYPLAPFPPSQLFFWDSFLVRALDLWSKGCEFESQQERRKTFFSRVNFVCWLLVGVFSSPMFLQWHVKDPGHSAKSSVQVAGFTLTCMPLTQQSQSGLSMWLSKHRVGTYPETSLHATCQGKFGHRQTQLTEPLWPDPGIKSGISLRELISTLKKKKGADGEWMVEHSPKILASEEVATDFNMFFQHAHQSLSSYQFVSFLTLVTVCAYFVQNLITCMWCSLAFCAPTCMCFKHFVPMVFCVSENVREYSRVEVAQLHCTDDCKVAGWIPSRSSRIIFLSRENFLCSYSVSVPPPCYCSGT